MPILSPQAQLPLLHSSLRHKANSTPRATIARWLAVVGLLLGGCKGGDGLFLPREGEPAAIEVVRGNDQSGYVGEPLAQPLVVEVSDSRNRPVEGATVSFEVSPASPGADVVPHTATTDANGQASAQIVLGTTIGRQTGVARLVLDAGSLPPQAAFTAMALSENANNVAAVAGEDQTGHVGAPLDERLVVRVTDTFGNPIAGVPISWEAQGGGTVSDATVNTDGQGRASVERVLGPSAGQQTTVATSEGLAGSPVTFVHTALAGDASRLTIVSGDDQTGQVRSQLPAELVVRLIDGQGNGVPNTAVAWVVATGGGSVTPANSNTDDEGRASARWTLGGTPGGNRLDAVVSGVGVVSFEATATAGAPAALSIRTQPSLTARNGVRLERQPVVQLRDAGGNSVALAGVQVEAALGAGGGDLSGTRQRVTDGSGRATFTDLAISGPPGRYTLVFSSSGYASTTSNGIDLRSISTNTSIVSDTPDPSVPGTAVTVEFRVSSDGPTPSGTVTVSDGGESCSGTLQGGAGSCALTLSNPGSRTLTARYLGGPGLEPSSGTAPHQVTTPQPTNQPPVADYNWHCEGLTCQFTDRSSDRDGSVVGWSWDFGDGKGSNDQNPAHIYSEAKDYTVRLTVTDNQQATGTTTATVRVNAPAPPELAIRTEPSDVAAGATISPAPVVQITDAQGNDLATAGVAITVGLDEGDGNLEGTRTVTTDGNGRAQFTDLRISGATGRHRLIFTAGGYRSVTSERFDVNKASTTTSITSDEPDPSDPNQPVTVVFKVDWAASAGTATGRVDVTVTDGGAHCDGPIDASGNGSCTLTDLSTPGARTLTATYRGDDLFSGSGSAGEAHTVSEPPPPNQAPTANPDPYTVSLAQGGSFTTDGSSGLLFNDTDPENDGMSVVSHSNPSAGVLTNFMDNGTFSYTVTDPTATTDSFTYSIRDENGNVGNSTTVTITITP